MNFEAEYSLPRSSNLSLALSMLGTTGQMRGYVELPHTTSHQPLLYAPYPESLLGSWILLS
ncbi:hypothetical protein HZS_4251 [Henneguya salminicola]|nr:hypothetical protein HZS_4251 [Henneguya salminicola]